MQYNSSHFLCETIVPKDEIIVSRTDLKGIITYVNDTFAQISGYEADELIGEHHNIVRHPDMPKTVFKELWESLQKNAKWSGYIKNLRKDQGFYWVYAEISGVYKENKLFEYKSLRTPITFEKKLECQIKYDKLRLKTNDYVRKVIYEKIN